ncbi:hypothetical protein B0H17DRAFT_1140329 [Mycena rosella]|uniref:Uncharacterized protein n=1 Tax=Mycena rosella TaxID=1033263 RepID=A0AAD7D2M5_MYCRO|nr:hypothetical protein B0H17DRAFT_1140329 [Mycena rosella]
MAATATGCMARTSASTQSTIQSAPFFLLRRITRLGRRLGDVLLARPPLYNNKNGRVPLPHAPIALRVARRYGTTRGGRVWITIVSVGTVRVSNLKNLYDLLAYRPQQPLAFWIHEVNTDVRKLYLPSGANDILVVRLRLAPGIRDPSASRTTGLAFRVAQPADLATVNVEDSASMREVNLGPRIRLACSGYIKKHQRTLRQAHTASRAARPSHAAHMLTGILCPIRATQPLLHVLFKARGRPCNLSLRAIVIVVSRIESDRGRCPTFARRNPRRKSLPGASDVRPRAAAIRTKIDRRWCAQYSRSADAGSMRRAIPTRAGPPPSAPILWAAPAQPRSAAMLPARGPLPSSALCARPRRQRSVAISRCSNLRGRDGRVAASVAPARRIDGAR